jgi:hypothetical protein
VSSTLPAHLDRRLASQVETWRRDLLNLDRRQKLVYFKHAKTASLELTGPSPAALFGLATQPVRVASSAEKVPSGSAVAFVADKSESEVTAACRRLDLLSQQVYADRGFWTLYLGLGMLTWVDPADGRVAEAPIVLCPVDLKRKGSQAPYQLVRNDDDVVINPALRLHLEKAFSITLPTVELDDPDVGAVLAAVRGLVRGRTGWAVEDRTVMTTFSFHKEAIYRDLADHEDSVTSHPIVRLVALGADAPEAGGLAFGPIGGTKPLDETVAPEDLVSILDADSSQRACIIAARDGRSFVMDGPPGTGKSQTIANIVAELISMGRKVLFVSEKAAALDVVRDRLASKGLGDFLLELHSHAATRKEVVKQLNDSLTTRMTGRGGFTDGERSSLQSTRRELTAFSAAMNQTRAGLERSVYDALGRLVALEAWSHRPIDDPAPWRELTAAELAELLETAGRLSRAWRPVTLGEQFAWSGLAASDHSASQVDALARATADLRDAAHHLVERSEAVDADLMLSRPMTVEGARQRRQLLQQLEVFPDVPDTWLTTDDTAHLSRRVTDLQHAVARHAHATSALAAVVGPDGVDKIDPDASAAVAAVPTGLAWTPDDLTTADGLAASARFLDESPVALASVLEDARQIGGFLGVDVERVSLARAVELGSLAALGGSATPPEAAWLNPAVQAALDESTRVLASVVALVNERRTAIEQVFTPAALQTDLAGLDVRFRESHRGLRALGGAARADKKLLKSITVSGKSDKAVRARLGEAAAWQQAESQLGTAESQHATRLGSYYQRTATDFGRIEQAISTAREAIRLAGNDLNAGRMVEQLTKDGQPGPRLTIVAERLLGTARAWLDQAGHRLGRHATAELADAPLDLAASRARSAAAALTPVVAAAAHVRSAAGRDVSMLEARTAHEGAVELSAALVAVYDRYDADVELLGPAYAGLETDWTRLTSSLAWLSAVRDLLGGAAYDRQVERLRRPIVQSAEVGERLERYTTARDAWLAAFAPARRSELGADLDRDLVEAVDLLGEMHESCVTDVSEWGAYVAGCDALRAAGLDDALNHLHLRRMPSSSVEPTIEWAVLQAWAEATISADARLRHHRAVDRDSVVDRFRDLDRSQVHKANVAVASACSARRPSSMTGSAAQLIRREALKKTRHLPIRELLSKTHEVVQELKPCFMMSPLSVSQFLPGDMAFDTVIFDEASQVLPSDAVNCIYRGTQLIVAGDEKQLPPTAFFAQATSEEDVDEELDIFESVLSSCKSAMTSLPLTWHYRSQHESLITYSNHRFYAPDGEPLQTFPGATFESPDLGVASYVVEGVYRRGGARDNPIEAEAVVDRVLFHREHHPELSIGVVTFSSAQEAAISSAIETRAITEPALAGLLDDHDRLSGFFVKNLENVQGDERDIIVFSIGYGPDETGAFTMNFGPVGRKGGGRRLNVAVTRARRRVEVVSSFHASAIREGANESLASLKGYLDFAARGMTSIAGELGSIDDSPVDSIEADVRDLVTSWGYEVDSRVGSSDYRVDLAVRHPDREGEYVLGIECDGPSYDSARTARDRDRLRHGVLDGLGWSVFRVWSIGWYRDRRGESARLRRALEAALAGDRPQPLSQLPAGPVELETEDVDLDAPPSWTVPYRRTTASAAPTPYALSEVESRGALQSYLAVMLSDEAPIHRDLLFQRVRDAFGVGRVGVRIRDNIEFVASRMIVNGQAVTVDDAGFYRLGGPAATKEVRSPSDEATIRTVAQTPPEELDLAVTLCVRDAVTADDDAVLVAVRQVFGWRRAGSDIQSAVLASIERCVRDSTVTRAPTGSLRAS